MNRGRTIRVRDVRRIIALAPSEFTIQREESTSETASSFGPRSFGPTGTTTYGPFTGIIEPFRHTRVADVFDEKGSSSTHGYLLMAVAEGDLLSVDAIKLNDIIVRGNESFRVTSPHQDGGLWEVNIELFVR